jgi:hypothetical protein
LTHDVVVAEINLQYKNTDICYDFYCPCDPDEPQHYDGIFGGEFTCRRCHKRWKLPHRIEASAAVGDERARRAP